MTRIVVSLLAAFTLGGCTVVTEAYLLDQEFGQATQASLEGQIAYPDYRYADVTPEGMEGVNAEGTMDIYNQSFAEPPAEEVEIFNLGFAGGSRN